MKNPILLLLFLLGVSMSASSPLKFITLFFNLGLACVDNQFAAILTKHYATSPADESFKLYRGTNEYGTLLLTVNGTSSDASSDRSYSLCLEQTDYYLVYYDVYGDGWGNANAPAYLYITVGGIRIFRGGLPYQSGTILKTGSASFTVSLVSTALSQWKYTDASQSSNAWTQNSFDDSNWSTATAGSFPAFTAATRYYRLTGTLADRAPIPALYTSINNTYGFVYYLQGTEVYRYHMPSSAVTPTTAATVSNGTYPVVVSANKYLLPVSGSFTIAYEVHLTEGTSGAADLFSCSAFLGSAGNEGDLGHTKWIGGTASADPESPSIYFTSDKLFDEGKTSCYATPYSGNPIIYYELENGRAEWINYYSIMSSTSSYYGYPTAWTLYGSNDGTNWHTLDIQNNVVFASTTLLHYYSLRANVNSYSKYKLDISACSEEGRCSMAQINGYTGIFANEVTGLSYDAASFTGYAYIDSISMAPAINGYSNFQIDPALPAGVLLASSNGIISGTPTEAVSGTYTVTATSYITSQTSQTQITLNIQLCSGPSQSLVRFMKVSQNWANEESYTITDVNGQTYVSPAFTNYATQYFLYCLPAGIINVHLADSYGDGWTAGTSLSIQVGDGEGDYYVISNIYYRLGGSNDFSYEIGFNIHPQSSSWTYSTSLIDNWYGTGAVSGFSAFDPVNPPASNGHYVWFFRATVSMNPTGYEGFEMRVKARAGYVIYVNGVEFVRKNLPDGDITTTTGATGGEGSSTYRFISGPNSVFSAGSNVIAIGIVNLSSNNPATLLFDATLQQIRPNDIGRTFDVTLTASPEGTGITHLNDLSYSTHWYAEQPLKADFVITYTYGTHRAEHFNKYCVTSSNLASAYDPSDWAIYGSNDGLTFELLGNLTNAYFSGRTVTRCFFMPNNKKAFNIYRMIVTETAVPTASPYGLAITELSFSMVDLDQLEVPAFSLDADTYIGYVGVPFPEVTPSSDLYTDFSITPALQLPLEIDTSTGSIRGTPVVTLPRSTYTISAKTPKGETVSTQVTLGVENCAFPNNQFSILIQSGNAGDEMGFALKDSSGRSLLSKSRFVNEQANYYPQCLASGTYTLSLTDSGSDGWDIGYFRVLLADDTVILYGSLGADEASKDFNFYIGYLVTPKYASYQYLNSGASAPTDWTQPQSSATSTWKEAKPGEFGDFVGTTAYFRKTFIVDNLDSYASLAFSVKTTYGVIVYINGEQVYSYNMPDEAITYNTKCEVKHNQLMNVGSSIAVQYSNLVLGANVVCFEVHVADPSVANIIDFDSTIQFTAESSFRLLDGVASSDLDVDDELYKLFDNVKGTVYISGPRCVGAAPQWTYNNDRREFISSYTLITGPRCNVRTPSAWRIEASNDGHHWSVLHEAERQVFEEYGVERTYNFYNTRVFNQYRMVVTECSNTAIEESKEGDCSFESGNGFQLAELSLFAKRLQAACEPSEDGFGGAVEGEYAYKDCAMYYSGRYQAMCTGGHLGAIQDNCSPMAIYGISYGSDVLTTEQKTDFSFTPVVNGAEFTCTLSPEPAEGVSFEASTGRLYGRHELISEYSYTVTCSNVAGSYSTEVKLSFTEKKGLPLWAWIVIVVVVVVVVILIIICIAKGGKANRARLSKRKDVKVTMPNAKAAGESKTAKL